MPAVRGHQRRKRESTRRTLVGWIFASIWLMALPAGWVTDVPGITRNDQLKALGNGVVPPQCAAALRAFLHDTKDAA